MGTFIVNDIVVVRRLCLGAEPIRIVTCRNAFAARASSVAQYAADSFQSNPSALSV
ncbi:hypothetical protein L665_04182 [Ralstonia solanacearum SD54]|nr:hypothetical protein F504_2963 [Ralstonia pseudosolanacearum FQY_4]ANH31698.1 hypothetical protein A3768_0520 [Ralstonia solanacearum]ARU20874.1 Clp protease proteolytic subunit ClpP [Ralstonia solanacearum]ESS48988.1 hypothetical protein L665_04182 [Ralstonia solanacearum SD54]